jgi:hypothetical protein
MGSGLDDWIYWQFFAIATNYKRSNQWLPKIRSIPYWTMNVFSTVMNDERRITAPSLTNAE